MVCINSDSCQSTQTVFNAFCTGCYEPICDICIEQKLQHCEQEITLIAANINRVPHNSIPMPILRLRLMARCRKMIKYITLAQECDLVDEKLNRIARKLYNLCLIYSSIEHFLPSLEYVNTLDYLIKDIDSNIINFDPDKHKFSALDYKYGHNIYVTYYLQQTLIINDLLKTNNMHKLKNIAMPLNEYIIYNSIIQNIPIPGDESRIKDWDEYLQNENRITCG
jgi:hypothetical protein